MQNWWIPKTRTKRLNADATIDELGLWDGTILRIFPESIAGMISDHRRVSTLVADHKNLEELRRSNPKIDFIPNTIDTKILKFLHIVFIIFNTNTFRPMRSIIIVYCHIGYRFCLLLQHFLNIISVIQVKKIELTFSKDKGTLQ